MGRNIGSTNCVRCGKQPKLVEKPRAITRGDAGIHFDEHASLAVARARCTRCRARYIAWVADIPMFTEPGKEIRKPIEGVGFFDLSFRGSFGSKPGFGDAPRWEPPITIEVPREIAMSVQFYLLNASCPDFDLVAAEKKDLDRHRKLFIEALDSLLKTKETK